MQKLRYLTAYLLAITFYISFTSTGIITFLPILISFVCIPMLELFFKPNTTNSSEEKQEQLKKDPYFKWLLYSIVPLQIGLILVFLFNYSSNLSTADSIGRIASLGIACGIFSINVGHELGHKSKRFEQLLGEILLLTSFETHFLPYHNSGHHYLVATPNDPATARKGENVYAFWFRSQFGSYKMAWQIENHRLQKKQQSVFSIQNKMMVYTLAQLTFLLSIYVAFGFNTTVAFVIGTSIGILMLETVNYIEHYGLLRKQKENGNYERTQAEHSWNSDHMIGRTLLFELSRHSDHHYKASKPYQTLNSMPNSPQMITGYPGMMLLAMVPPLWFKVMHKQLEEFKKSLLSQ